MDFVVAYFKLVFKHLIGGAKKCDKNGQVGNIPAQI
jgi:hypothetical protein